MEHIWKIDNLNRNISDNVVTEVDFVLESTTQDPYFYLRKFGKINITGSISDPNFIPFEDLKESEVLNWVETNINMGEWEAEISASLALLVDGYMEPISQEGLPENFNVSEEV